MATASTIPPVSTDPTQTPHPPPPHSRKGAWVNAFDFGGGAEGAEGAEGASSPFLAGAPERSFFNHSLLTTRDEQWERANSKSYIQNLPEADRAELEVEIRGIMETHAGVFSHVRGGGGGGGDLCAELSIRCEVAIARCG